MSTLPGTLALNDASMRTAHGISPFNSTVVVGTVVVEAVVEAVVVADSCEVQHSKLLLRFDTKLQVLLDERHTSRAFSVTSS